MQPKDFLKTRIKNKSLKPVTLFTGSEFYWKELHLNAIKASFFKKDSAMLNIFKFNALNTSVTDIISEANAFGFFQASKLIIYTHIEHLNALEQKSLIKYIESPNLETYLILDSVKLDARSALASSKILKTEKVDYEIKSSADIIAFMTFKLKQMGNLKIEKKLEQYLLETFQKNLLLLSNNLEKIAAHNGYTSPLMLKDAVIANSYAPNTSDFSFMDAIVEKDIRKAMKINNILSKNKSYFFKIIGLLRWQFLLLLKASEMLKNRIPPDTVISQCKISAFKKAKFFQQLKKYKEKEIMKKYELIAECDYALKSSSVSQTHIFEILIYDLCQ